jgi:hypothetical protein
MFFRIRLDLTIGTSHRVVSAVFGTRRVRFWQGISDFPEPGGAIKSDLTQSGGHLGCLIWREGMDSPERTWSFSGELLN